MIRFFVQCILAFWFFASTGLFATIIGSREVDAMTKYLSQGRTDRQLINNIFGTSFKEKLRNIDGKTLDIHIQVNIICGDRFLTIQEDGITREDTWIYDRASNSFLSQDAKDDYLVIFLPTRKPGLQIILVPKSRAKLPLDNIDNLEKIDLKDSEIFYSGILSKYLDEGRLLGEWKVPTGSDQPTMTLGLWSCNAANFEFLDFNLRGEWHSKNGKIQIKVSNRAGQSANLECELNDKILSCNAKIDDGSGAPSKDQSFFAEAMVEHIEY